MVNRQKELDTPLSYGIIIGEILEEERKKKEQLMSDKIELRVTMDRDLFNEIRTAILARYLSHGSVNGLADSFLARFVEKVDAGLTEWEVKKK